MIPEDHANSPKRNKPIAKLFYLMTAKWNNSTDNALENSDNQINQIDLSFYNGKYTKQKNKIINSHFKHMIIYINAWMNDGTWTLFYMLILLS